MQSTATFGRYSPTAPSIWRNRNFLIFWGGQSISLVGSAMASFALPLLVLEATGSVAKMGQVAALAGVGSLIASIVSGMLADRVNRRFLLMWCDGLNLLLYASIPAVWSLFGPQMPLIYAIAAPLGYLGTTFFIGYSAVITNLVPRDQLTVANSRLQSAIAISAILGPSLAGIMISRWDATSVMTANAMSFAVSVATIGLIRLLPVAGDPRKAEAGAGLVSRVLAGMRFIGANPTLRWMVVVRSGMFVLTGGVYAILLYRLRHELGISAETTGLIFGVASVGAVLSSVIAPRIRGALGFGLCFLGGTALNGMSILLRGIVIAPWQFIVLMAFSSLGDTLVVINTMSLRQALTPDHLQGRVTAFLQMSTYVLSPLSTALFTALADRLHSAGAILILMGCLTLLLVVIGAFTPVRLRHPERVAETATVATAEP